MIAYAKFNGFLTGVFLIWKLSIRCYCHLVEYPTMPLIFIKFLVSTATHNVTAGLIWSLPAASNTTERQKKLPVTCEFSGRVLD